MTSVAFSARLNKDNARTKTQLDTMQLNITRYCNLSCKHCHLECNPARDEIMSRATMELALKIFERDGFKTLDITGGAPESHPDFEWLITESCKRGFHTMVRSNLVILEEEGYTHLPELFANLGVEVIASLPCYTQENVDAQRGKGTFERDIRALKRLSALGYGKAGSGLILNLVYNSLGAVLPGDQCGLENDYRRQLDALEISFNNLYAMTNMNIGQFRKELKTTEQRAEYDLLLEENFNADTLDALMCRTQISIAPDGSLYDCDFNQAISLSISSDEEQFLEGYTDKPLSGSPRAIRFANHCYACTAGAGSSCTGTTI